MKKSIFLWIFGTLLITLGCSLSTKYDYAIINGTVYSGEGTPWFKADIGIRGERIAYIGKIQPDAGRQVIEAKGLFICPGFIDIHTHADRKIADIPTAENYLLQGVTTVIGGNCGSHQFPIARLFQKLEHQGIAINFASLAGHNTIRREVMGLKMTPPTREEMEKMKALIDQEMKAGALGFSTGLAYMPGTYASTDELIALTGVIAKYGGFYASHIRNQAEKITEAIQEAIRIGEESGVRVQISHIKLASDAIWGKEEKITAPIAAARKKGVEVFCDQYPYTATSSGFGSSLPSWALEGGREKLVQRLRNKELHEKIRRAVIARRLTSSRGIDKLKTIYVAMCQSHPEYEGKNLKEILSMQGKAPTIANAADLIIDMQRNGGARGVFFQMDEPDVEALMQLEYNMVASDGEILAFNEGVPHCRSYGTFPRVLYRYVLEKHVLTLEKAIQKMSALPAQMLRLNNRGVIKEKMYADLVLFDPKTIRDTATYQNPHQYPTGIKYVFVNGKLAAINGKSTGVLAGKVLYGPGKK